MADSSEDDDRLDYIKKDYFYGAAAAAAADDKSTGEDSINLFMSEPSTSEADSSEQRMRLMSPLGSLSDDSADEDCLPPPQPPPARLLNVPTPHSPGNTSLSSWESPHFDGRQVHIHFTPDRTKREGQSSPLNFDVTTRPLVPAGVTKESNGQLPLSNDAKTSVRRIEESSNSTSPASDGKKQQLEVFLDDLRFQSEGKVKEQSAANMSFEESFKGGDGARHTQGIIGSIHRIPQHTRTSSVDTAVVQNTSGSEAGLSVPILPRALDQHHNNPTDTSIAMVFSASEDESTERNVNDVLNWGARNAGDDEKKPASKEAKAERQRRSRNGHRRQRSGDAAAATLSTGSKEWKGMEQDRIPMPPVPGEHDETDDDVQQKRRAKGRSGATSAGNLNPRKGFTIDVATPGVTGGEDPQFANFAVGLSGQGQSSLLTSRSRRDDSRARMSYGTPDFAQSPVPSVSPPRRTSDRSFFRNARRSFDTPTTSSNFSGHYPGSERNYRRSSYAHAGEFFGQGLHFGTAESPTYPSPSMRGKTWQRSPRQDVYGSFHYPQGCSPHSESDSSSLRRSGMVDGSPLVQTRRKRDEPQIEVLYPLESVAPEALRGVRFENPILQPPLKTPTAPFINVAGKPAEKVDRRSFLPQISATGDEKDCPTYICPVCKTRQREFFTVTSAPRQFESPSGYIALYFGIYVVAALYIFGLQEGWGKLDCFYFAVITLTTAGLGDFVPTSDSAKVICSIFIYFGVACIGLLLGSYIAGMLDETSSRRAMANRIKACPNCTRIQNIKDDAERRAKAYRKGVRAAKARYSLQQARHFMSETQPSEPTNKKIKRRHGRVPSTMDMTQSDRPGSFDNLSPRSKIKAAMSPPLMRSPRDITEPKSSPPSAQTVSHNMMSPETQQEVLVSPMTSEILGRQSHTRHASLDIGANHFASVLGRAPSARRPSARRRFSAERPTSLLEAGSNAGDATRMSSPQPHPSWESAFRDMTSDYRSDGEESSESDESSISEETVEIGREEKYSSVKNAKYVFLTLREALLNSMVIIAFGCMGFYFIEGFSFVDSWYFTTVLLTTVGYGDIVPYTKGGKLFATVYILVAGTILLNNMSMISMIPLELRRRRTELAVLNQFGDSLDDAALRELATGPLIQRLNLSTSQPGGLDECTREMFSLAMLVRLGKVTEEDITLTFAAFRKLDVHNDGVLNSKSIIAGMIQKRKTLSASYLNLAALNVQQQQQQQQLQTPQTAPIIIETLNDTGQRNASSWMNGWGNSFSNGYGWFDSPEHSNAAATEYSSLVRGQPTYGIHQPPSRDLSADSGSAGYFSS